MLDSMFVHAEEGSRVLVRSAGLGEVYMRQVLGGGWPLGWRLLLEPAELLE